MAQPELQEVFKTSGVPTHTFVEPTEWARIIVNLRTPGRALVVEGPSGIGKTTSVINALESVGLSDKVVRLSARRPEDVEYINALPTIPGAGVVVVDDFHKLAHSDRAAIAEYLKVLADEEDESVKLIVVGINKAGQSLISFAHDLVHRLDIVSFEANPDNKVAELITKGEKALNITINVSRDIIDSARGSFYLAQLLCSECCTSSGLLAATPEPTAVDVSLEAVQAAVWDRLYLSFGERCRRFCRGNKFRPRGRAPYLNILRWLAQSEDWTLELEDAMRLHQELRGSVGQVVEKGFLHILIEGDQELQAVLHYDDDARQLTVEDPQFMFFIRQIPWRSFADKTGFEIVDYDRRYDFALSFAGADRDLAGSLADELRDQQVEVFYDRYEQHRIVAENLEDYLRPIYQSEARFVVVLMGPEYPKRIWTKFESDAFRSRFSEGAIIPIWYSTTTVGMFDETRTVGGLGFDPEGDIPSQVTDIVAVLVKKLTSVS